MGTSAAQEQSISDRLKIWQRILAHNKEFGIGDVNFLATKRDFEQLHRKSGLPGDLEREMSMLALEGSALKIASSVFREYPEVSAMTFWGYLERRLYNETQRRSQHAKFLGLRWNERMKYIFQYGERVNVLGTWLGYGFDIMQDTFIKELSPRLQSFAYTTQGGLDEHVFAMSQVVDIQRKNENVRPVTKAMAQSKTGKHSLRLQNAVSHEAKAGIFASIICY